MPSIFDKMNAHEVAAYIQEFPGASETYLGAALFPHKSQDGIDISWLKGANNLPVTIQPSEYDAKAMKRERTGFKSVETEMGFFREAMSLGEKDRQLLNKLDPKRIGTLAANIVNQLFDDTKTLVEGVDATAEYARMQLLQYGKFTLKSVDSSTVYEYDYNMQASQKITTPNAWTDPKTSNPVTDILGVARDMEARRGTRPTRLVMNATTFQNMIASESIKKAMMVGVSGNAADLFLTDAQLRSTVERMVEMKIFVYSKQVGVFDDVSVTPRADLAKAVKLIDDHNVVFLPEGNLGNTHFGTTPEQSDLIGGHKNNAEVAIASNGATIMSYVDVHPVNIHLVVSAVLAPSFERIDDVAVLTTGA